MTREHYQLKRRQQRRNNQTVAVIVVITMIGLAAIAVLMR